MDNNKVWFITGASKGFGLSLVKQLLDAGQLVAATSRNLQELTAAVNTTSNNFLPLQVDLVNDCSVSLALQHTYEAFGRIDVVINNAGYGIGGAIEELSDAETRMAFDVNVFGTLNVIRAAMPYLRKQRSGHIINISSIAGITANTGWAIYAGAKYAVIGISEVLAADVKELGIKVTVVAPGAFRTSFLTAGSLSITDNQIDDYTEVRAIHNKYLKMDGKQAGDPEKAATAIINTVYEENPPLYLLLGGDAYNRALAKLDTLHNEIRQWEDVTCSTDF
ncbi:SDR family NAD(P)-dependent oxidoreductase [Mucilaginibacter rubeus]|uniref:SDR family NAD(P)-dependent oxidoreductase n=1 Tax=Mucilaginibacter rubeus TaxID=2027860 RepID=A0AAE6MKC9_9SPHI|nr:MULTISPECIES: oxidoreductase [Mucilaginibacter]QEM06097.1 SDR family NAD(P)-dependent oxidoreductase [Mucilaginibacter rubeus]QEM18677.1 SDR family NAD(P)-dependent oxidoreductase [Mucilaginibacter gossypii]QTE44780.1 SDR family NAD(P)-dependent oxidoreductase [Mucilaginibacter rubeus]QTE51378.1 SDR family NAD(P)-dependent oxidoreductase [Mucilaginibacter rubeus]QTE56465.1 SDR family NAD(P)-dependent oxidoreductase [Mucilaginibacter rubeus]